MGKRRRQHMWSIHPTNTKNTNPTWIVEQLKNWVKLKGKPDCIRAEFHCLDQATDTLAKYIDKATILCDSVGFKEGPAS